MLSVETVGVALVGYLLGSIPFGVIVAKRYGVDIFSVGSGNPGATNVLRSVGKPAGYVVFFLDFLKGLIAVTWFLFPWVSFSGDSTLGLWGLPGAVLGHTYPIFSSFRGGKGVATTMGGLLGVMPGCLIIGLVTWVIIFFSTRYVALASIGFGVSLPVCAIVNVWSNPDHSSVIGTIALAFVIMVWIIWRHRSNIVRLR
ncbi:glycerol-3-phosphate 1-O-acyltransferase PlsY, partial [Opitutales bacterium]|nr:glycerol-3-phosphate 1-O-acyltransferase PlsY [Opitutales bacterium]